jgi:hypothetical protein
VRFDGQFTVNLSIGLVRSTGGSEPSLQAFSERSPIQAEIVDDEEAGEPLADGLQLARGLGETD